VGSYDYASAPGSGEMTRQVRICCRQNPAWSALIHVSLARLIGGLVCFLAFRAASGVLSGKSQIGTGGSEESYAIVCVMPVGRNGESLDAFQ
jgi:hypothetical protein